MDLTQIATVLFALAAVNGLALATCFFMQKPRPAPLAVIHFLFAASGLTTLALSVWRDPSMMLTNVALGILFVVALGGFWLFSFRLRGKPIYAPLLVAHALGAIMGFVCLVLVVFGKALDL
jgi:hypothetical protein